MTIGIGLAILISTILYLIDRNHAWPQAWKIFKKLLKVAAVLFVVAAIGTGIIVALDARKEAIERHQIEATKAREQAAEDKAAKEAEAYRLAHEVDAQAATMEEEKEKPRIGRSDTGSGNSVQIRILLKNLADQNIHHSRCRYYSQYWVPRSSDSRLEWHARDHIEYHVRYATGVIA